MRVERIIESTDESSVLANLSDLYQVYEFGPGEGAGSAGLVFGTANALSYAEFPTGVANDWIINRRVRRHLMGKGSQLSGLIDWTTTGTSTTTISLDVQIRPIKAGNTGTAATWASQTLTLTPSGVASTIVRTNFSFTSSVPDTSAEGWAFRFRRNVDSNIQSLRILLVVIRFVEVSS